MHFDSGARYYLPAIPCLLVRGCHPAVDALERRHDLWLQTRYPFATIRDKERFLSHRSTLWTAVTYPTTDPARFHDLSRLTSFLFAFDDMCLDHEEAGQQRVKAVLADCLAVMDGAAPATAHGQAFNDIWVSMSARMPPQQARRLVAAVLDFSRGCFTEIAARSDGAVLDFDGYVTVRLRQSLAAWIYFILTEYAGGVDLGEAALDGMRTLHWACAEHLLYSNDLFSFRTEHFAGDHVNAICVLITEGATLQQAINQVAALVAEKERQVAAWCDQIRTSSLGVRPNVRAYLEKLEYVISGNLGQARFAPRYHGTHDFIGRPIETGQITLWPNRTEYRADAHSESFLSTFTTKAAELRRDHVVDRSDACIPSAR